MTEEPSVVVHDTTSVTPPFFQWTEDLRRNIELSRHQAHVDCQVRAVPRRDPPLESFVLRLGQGVRPVPEDCSIDNVFAVDALPVHQQQTLQNIAGWLLSDASGRFFRIPEVTADQAEGEETGGVGS